MSALLRWVVTGANRGIGLEFVRQLAARGDEVVATVRDLSAANDLQGVAAAADGRVNVVPCDTSSDQSTLDLLGFVGPRVVDVIINNAGVMGAMTALEELDFAEMTRTFDVNALGPLRVAQALLPALLRGPVRRIVSISSGMGSIEDNTSGGAYGYRISKAALNMANRSMSVDLRDRGFTCVVMNPGWVQTDMGGAGAPLPVVESVASLIRIIDGLTPRDSGKFINYRGNEFAW